MRWFSWLKPAEYARLETLMDFKALRPGPGRAAVRWEFLAPHPKLSEPQIAIALATLQYARTLVNHTETRAELFHRVGRGAQGLIAGDAALSIDPWHLVVLGRSFQIWPWTFQDPEQVESPKTYVARLLDSSDGALGIHLKMAFGATRVLAPAAALIPLFILSKTLGGSDLIRLGRTLQAVNQHYGTPDRSGRLLSEPKALQAAMPALMS